MLLFGFFEESMIKRLQVFKVVVTSGMANIFKQTLTDGKDMIRFHMVPILKNSPYKQMVTVTLAQAGGGATSRKVPVEQARDTYRLYTKAWGFKPTTKSIA